MTLSPLQSRARWLQRLQILKYYNVLEQESRFTLGLNAAKNTDYIKKCLKLKLFRIKFPTKNLSGTYIYLSQEQSQESPKICH